MKVKITEVNPKNHTYDDGRLESKIVQWMLEVGKLSRDEAADILGLKLKDFNNKMYRSNFSFREILTLSVYTNTNLYSNMSIDNILTYEYFAQQNPAVLEEYYDF